jgi:hypothetical protein
MRGILFAAAVVAAVAGAARADQIWISIEELQEGETYTFASMSFMCLGNVKKTLRFVFGAFKSRDAADEWAEQVYYVAANSNTVRPAGGWEIIARVFLKREVDRLWEPSSLRRAFKHMKSECKSGG